MHDVKPFKPKIRLKNSVFAVCFKKERDNSRPCCDAVR